MAPLVSHSAWLSGAATCYHPLASVIKRQKESLRISSSRPLRVAPLIESEAVYGANFWPMDINHCGHKADFERIRLAMALRTLATTIRMQRMTASNLKRSRMSTFALNRPPHSIMALAPQVKTSKYMRSKSNKAANNSHQNKSPRLKSSLIIQMCNDTTWR